MQIIKLLKRLIVENNEHFISVDSKIYNRYKYLIRASVFFNKNYKSCEIKRKKFKSLENFVVVGLKFNGKNVKRRTSGYAKRFIETNTDSICLYCGVNLNHGNATADHIVPISKGGNNCQVNLIVVCNGCNSERGDIDMDEFIKIKNPNTKIKLTYI
jgi:5-methylcytosine-specific restriction endonuclease McrA